jgi:hypothetical protein
MINPKLKEVFARLAEREMRTRGLLVHQQPVFTANSVPGQADRPIPASSIRKWRRRRLIFGARYKGRDYFPAFQFSDGHPKPIVGRVISILDLVRREDNWFLFYWFVGANGWLEEGETPSNVMDSDAEAVIEAAVHANDQTSD